MDFMKLNSYPMLRSPTRYTLDHQLGWCQMPSALLLYAEVINILGLRVRLGFVDFGLVTS